MAAVTLRQEEPPRLAHGRANAVSWPVVVEQVARGRGKWFRCAEYGNVATASAAAGYANRRHNGEKRLEIVARRVGDKGVVYARLKTEGGK